MRTLRSRAYRLALVSGALALLAPTSAAGQNIPSPYRFIDNRQDAGIFVGIAGEKRGELGLGPGGGTLFGARYSIDISGPVAIELSGYGMPTDREVYGVQPGTGLVAKGKNDVLVMAVDARLRFTLTGPRTWHGMAPFILAGGGVVGSFESPTALEEDIPLEDRFGFGPGTLFLTGGGFRWIPSSRLTLRADATLQLWRIKAPVGFQEIAADLGPYPDKNWVGIPTAVLGLSFRF